MALTPLSFSIGVKDEASSQLEKINAELNNLVSKLDSIKNIAISLGGDPGEAESLMKSLNGVAASLANISRLSPEAQAASDKLTDSQQKLNAAMEEYNNLLAKIKSVNPTQVSEAFQKATKAAQSSMGVNFDRTAPGKFGDLSGLDPTKWAENLTQYLHKSLGTEQIEVNVRRLIANIRHIMASELSGLHKGPSLAPILEESFNFNSVNEKLNNAFRILREEFIKGMKQLQEVEGSKEGLGLVEKALPGLKAKVEAAQKEFETLKNVTSSTPINPEAFKGAEGAIAATNEATKMLGEAINKLDFSKINTALDQLAERLNKLVTELAGIEERMKTAFTGALEANVKSLGDVIDGLAKKMAGMSAPMSEGMKQGEQATRVQTDAAKSLSQVLQELSQKYKHTAEQAQKLAELASDEKLTKAGIQRGLKVGYNQATDILDTINAFKNLSQAQQQQSQVAQQAANVELEALKQKEKLTSTNKAVEQTEKELGQASQQTAEQIQKLAQSTVGEAFNQLAASLTKIKELFDNLGKAEGLTQLNNTINGVNTTVEALAKTLSNVSNAVKFTGSTEEIAAYEAKIKSLQEQVAALEAKAKGLGETAKAASEQVKTVTASGGGGSSSKDGLTEAQLKRVNDQLQLLQKRLSTIEPNYTKAKELGFSDEIIEGKIKHLKDYIAALNEATKAGSLSGIKVGGEYNLFSRAANEDVPTQAQAQKMAKQMQEYIAIQQQAQAEAERQAQAQERMRQAAEAAGMSIVKAGEQTQSAGQKSEGAKQQMHGFNEEILVNMRSWEKAGEMMAVLEKRIFAVMAQLQSGKSLGFDTGSLQSDIQELMRFYAIMKEIRNNYGFANIEGAMLTTSKVLKESGLDFGQIWEKNKQELTAVKTIYEQMMRLKPMADFQNTLPSANLNPKYQEEALANAKQAAEIMKWLQGSDLRKATAFVGGQDYKEATSGIEAFFRTYNQNANIAKTQTAELQRILEKIQGTDKGGGWISVMKSAGVSDDKINEMRQLAQKIQDAIQKLEQMRQMGRAADYVRSDEYRATVVEGKKANDTGYLAVREAHEQAAAEREAAKATQEAAKAAEKKREEINKAWREQDAARQKEAAAVEASMQKQMAAEEKARQKSIDEAWKAADQKIKADERAAQQRERTNQKTTQEEIKGYEQMLAAQRKREQESAKAAEKARIAAEKQAKEREKLYNAAGLRENDPGIQNMTAQLDALMQKIAKVRGDIEATRDFISKGNRAEQDFGLEQLRALEQEVNTLMRQYEALYQTRAALSAQVPFAETQRSIKNTELDQLNEKYRQEAKAAEEAANAKKKDAENSMAAGKAISDLQLKIDRYNQSNTLQKAKEFKIDTSDYERAIERLERYKRILEYINSESGSHHKPSTIAGIGASAENDVKRQIDALKRLISTQQETASATNQLTAEEQRLAQALNQTTEHARGQSQVLSDLKMMATQYLGVWGGQQFLHNIIEIGGQLEMQRMSIGAILQNQSQANELFDRIKSLATQSPFGVVELDQMTKQLTAYGFKYNELFDMTKRLADISAATGTGVDRLALALGHVRSEAALSGYTLRQFSMGNVPLLQKLSEKLGKTTAEIRKMVRSKEISYEDVESVIKDLTNEGGMFYNMQQVISESVKARFKNVKDSMAIMYGEMAESGIGDALKGVADALMEVTRNWKDAATVLGTGAALWAAQRAAVMAYTAAIGKNTAATFSSIAANTEKKGAMLRLANQYRVLTTAERDLMNASKANSAMIRLRTMLGMNYTKAQGTYIAAQRTIITNTLTQSLSEGKVTIAELAHMVATRKLSHEEARLIITNSTLNASLKEQALSIIGSVTQLGRLEIAFMRLGAVMRSIGSMALSFLPMAAITALIELWQHNKREMESAEEMANNVYEASKNATEATQRMMKETSIQKIDVNGSLAADNLQMPEFDKDTAESVMEQWTQYIREYAGTPNKLINEALASQADGVSSLADQYNKLGDAVKVVIEAQQKLGDFSDVFAAAQKGTDSGWFDDDVANDVKQYISTRKSLRQEIGKYYQENMKNVDRGIKKAREQDEAFRKNTEGMRSEAEMLIYLTENWGYYQDAIRAFGSETGENTDWIKRLGNNLRSQKSEMDVELRRYYAGLQQGLLASGENLDALSPSSQQMLIKGFKMFLDSLGNMSEQEYKERLDNFKKYFKITLDDAEENAQKTLTDWQRRAQDVFTVNSTIKVKSKTITDKDEFAQAVQKDLKEKQEYVDRNTKPIKQLFRIQPNIKFDTEYLAKYIKAISDQIFKLTESGQKEAAGILMSQLNDELLPYYNALRSLEEDEKWLKQEGYPKSDKENKKKSKSKSGTGSKEDKNAKAVRERVRILKEAADAFEYWNKKLGPTGAWERVNEQFGDVLSKIGVTIDNIEDLRGNLRAVANSKEYKAIKDQKVKLEIDKEIAKDLDQLNRKVFEKSIDEYKSKFTKTLDDLTRRWETFNSVRQATGSKAIALDIAGISEQDRDLRNAADAMRRKLVEEMRNAGGDSLVTAIPLDVYVDEEKLRDQFKAALGDNDEQAMKIDGLVEAYKRWQKAQQDVTKADIDAYAKIIGSVVDYASRIDRINDKLEQEKEHVEKLVELYNKSGGKEGISQDAADTANAILTANANFGKLKEGSDYINLMNRSLSMTKGEVTAAASAIEGSLNERLAAGVIKAEEYATEMKKLHDIVAKFDENSLFGSNSALTSFLSGGLKGSQSFVNDRIVSLTIKSNQEGLSEDEQNELDDLIELRKKLDSAISKLSGFAVALQVVTGALDGFHKAAQSLSEMFDALGKEGPASFWGDIADGISAVSSIFEPANNLVQNALSGNIGGVLSSAISAPVDMITGPITAFAKLHDKRLERAIERLREDVKSIEANTELIVRSRERTLGYDMGDVRRQMAQQYVQARPSVNGGIAALIKALSSAQQNKTMYDYYMQNSQGTGYQQEYDNLVEQREKYMEILKDQQDKKKKSNEEIEETKSKIAELDDQIMNFSQDLAKELWGIDIKGWADQLSDALASAFENGENMAKAYRDTVTSILQQMMQKMMQMQILEPMFANLQKDLFGENGKGGVFDPNNPKGSLSKVTKIIGDYFGKGGEGEKAITASMEFMTAFQRGMQNAGLTVLNEASNTLSSGIQGTSEETSDLLAGYVNALRQDVSVNRILLTQYVTQLWPQYIEAYTAQVTSVSNIDNNVRVIMEMMQLGNGAMYEQIAAMRSRIDNIVMGIDRVSVR